MSFTTAFLFLSTNHAFQKRPIYDVVGYHRVSELKTKLAVGRHMDFVCSKLTADSNIDIVELVVICRNLHARNDISSPCY
jgi:hypothetical protein